MEGHNGQGRAGAYTGPCRGGARAVLELSGAEDDTATMELSWREHYGFPVLVGVTVLAIGGVAVAVGWSAVWEALRFELSVPVWLGLLVVAILVVLVVALRGLTAVAAPSRPKVTDLSGRLKESVQNGGGDE